MPFRLLLLRIRSKATEQLLLDFVERFVLSTAVSSGARGIQTISRVKVPMRQCKNAPLQVKVLQFYNDPCDWFIVLDYIIRLILMHQKHTQVHFIVAAGWGWSSDTQICVHILVVFLIFALLWYVVWYVVCWNHVGSLQGKCLFGGTANNIWNVTRGPAACFVIPKSLGTTSLISNNALHLLNCK